jgi:hypothetical protein
MVLYVIVVASMGDLLHAFKVTPVALTISGVLCAISGIAAQPFALTVGSRLINLEVTFAAIFASIYLSLCLAVVAAAYSYRLWQAAR